MVLAGGEGDDDGDAVKARVVVRVSAHDEERRVGVT